MIFTYFGLTKSWFLFSSTWPNQQGVQPGFEMASDCLDGLSYQGVGLAVEQAHRLLQVRQGAHEHLLLVHLRVLCHDPRERPWCLPVVEQDSLLACVVQTAARGLRARSPNCNAADQVDGWGGRSGWWCWREQSKQFARRLQGVCVARAARLWFDKLIASARVQVEESRQLGYHKSKFTHYKVHLSWNNTFEI